MLMVLASRGALHGPMALLANFISVPVEVVAALLFGLAWTLCDQAVRLQSGEDSAECLGCGLQLALILPYVRVGEWITGSPRVELKPVGITELFKQGSGGKSPIKSPPIHCQTCKSSECFPCTVQNLVLSHCLDHYSPEVGLHRGVRAAADVLRSVGCALLAWALTWPLVAGGLYLATVPGFQLLRRKYVPCKLPCTVELPQCLPTSACLLATVLVPCCATMSSGSNQPHGRFGTVSAPAHAKPGRNREVASAHHCSSIQLCNIGTVCLSAQESQ